MYAGTHECAITSQRESTVGSPRCTERLPRPNERARRAVRSLPGGYPTTVPITEHHLVPTEWRSARLCASATELELALEDLPEISLDTHTGMWPTPIRTSSTETTTPPGHRPPQVGRPQPAIASYPRREESPDRAANRHHQRDGMTTHAATASSATRSHAIGSRVDRVRDPAGSGLLNHRADAGGRCSPATIATRSTGSSMSTSPTNRRLVSPARIRAARWASCLCGGGRCRCTSAIGDAASRWMIPCREPEEPVGTRAGTASVGR